MSKEDEEAEELPSVLGDIGLRKEFKEQSRDLYKYETKLHGYSMRKEEVWATSLQSPGYFTVAMSGAACSCTGPHTHRDAMVGRCATPHQASTSLTCAKSMSTSLGCKISRPSF